MLPCLTKETKISPATENRTICRMDIIASGLSEKPAPSLDFFSFFFLRLAQATRKKVLKAVAPTQQSQRRARFLTTTSIRTRDLALS